MYIFIMSMCINFWIFHSYIIIYYVNFTTQESKYFLFNNMPHLFLRDAGEDNMPAKMTLQNDEDVRVVAW